MNIDSVRAIALSLPHATEEPHHQFSSFRVHGKIFVTVPPDEEHIHVFVSEEDREIADKSGRPQLEIKSISRVGVKKK